MICYLPMRERIYKSARRSATAARRVWLFLILNAVPPLKCALFASWNNAGTHYVCKRMLGVGIVESHLLIIHRVARRIVSSLIGPWKFQITRSCVCNNIIAIYSLAALKWQGILMSKARVNLYKMFAHAHAAVVVLAGCIFLRHDVSAHSALSRPMKS